METILFYLVAIVVVAFIVKLLGKSMKVVWGVIINALVGGLIIWVLNLLGLGITLNWITALLVGFLGIPGVIIVVILSLLF